METIKTERYEACFELYLRYGGRNLSRIEREMRALGYADFNRRILYGRTENGVYKPGWIEKYEWREFKSGVLSLESEAGKIAFTLEPLDRISQNRPAQDSRLQTQDFQSWLKSVSPDMTWDWKHQQYIYKYLQRVTDGTCKRLMIFLPPRHGKSELVTVRYAGWRLRQDPKMRVILASYNQKLADKFSRSVRKLLSEEEDRLSGSPPYEGGVAGFSSPPGLRRGACWRPLLTRRRAASPPLGRSAPLSHTTNRKSQIKNRKSHKECSPRPAPSTPSQNGKLPRAVA